MSAMVFADVTQKILPAVPEEYRREKTESPVEENPSQSLICGSVLNLFQTVGWRQHNVIIGTGRESSTKVVTLARFHYLRICPNQLEGETGESRESAEQVSRKVEESHWWCPGGASQGVSGAGR